MWFNTELQLIQPAAGYKVGADISQEQWVLLKFRSAYLSAVAPSPSAGLYDFLGSMAEFPVMGRYWIVANHTGAPDSSFVIGRHADPANKVWRYNPSNQNLILGTVETWTGTASNGNQETTNITIDLVLHSALLTKRGFVVNGGGIGGHGTGFVNVASWTNRPFEARSLFWVAI